MHTGAETSFVNPSVHVCALILEPLQAVGGVFYLGSEIIDLLLVRANSIIEGASEWIRCWFHAATALLAGDNWLRSCGCVSYTVLWFACCGRALVGLQAVGRIEARGVLGIFVWMCRGRINMLLLLRLMREWARRHGDIWVVFGGTVPRKTAEPGCHGRRGEKRDDKRADRPW